MIGDEWFKRKLEGFLLNIVSKYGGSLSFSEKEKLVSVSLSIYSVIFTVSLFLFLIYFFSTMVYDSVGFEKTVIVLLSIIMLKVLK